MSEKVTNRNVLLRGIRPIMFDRYAGDNDTQLPPDKKMYFMPDGRGLCLPAINIMSLLCSTNTTSAPKRFLDSRKYKKICQAFLSYVMIEPELIPFKRDRKTIKFEGFNGDIYLHKSVARLKDGIPNPKERPVLSLPWSLEFNLSIMPNDEFQEQTLYDLMERGCFSLGLGTFRGLFGKCVIDKWE